jgi:hypothetical protein
MRNALKVNRSFGGICRLRLQGRRLPNQQEADNKQSPLFGVDLWVKYVDISDSAGQSVAHISEMVPKAKGY